MKRTFGMLALVWFVAMAVAPGFARHTNKQEGGTELSAAAVVAHIKYLASDELQGRGTGTSGGDKAAHYVADYFRSNALKPLGDHGTYFQHFEVTTGAKVGEKNSLTVTPPLRNAKLEMRNDFLPVPISGTGKASGEVVFVGYGIDANEPKYNDYAGLEVKGKIVLIMRHSPDGSNPHGQFDRYSSLRSKLMTARDKGAKAALFCVGPLSPKEIEELGPWSTTQGIADAGLPALFVKRDLAEGLLKAAGKSLKDVQQQINETRQPQSFAIPQATVTLSAEVIKEKKRAANVIGYLPGNDAARKQETIVIGAHYDHLGLGEQPGSLAPNSQGQIHHGADDNASGTAGVIELARYFAARRHELKRGMLFICFAGEEMGLLGSKHFVDHPTIPLDRIITMINLDMVGRVKNDRVQVLGAGTSPFWKEALTSANSAAGLSLKLDVAVGTSGFGGSDHQSFYLHNIPVLFFFTGVHEDYHRPSDTWDRINGEGEAQILKLTARLAEQVQALEKPMLFVKLEEPRPTSGGGSGGFRVYLGTVPDYGANVEGVRLDAVRDNSPAAKAGLRAGDVVIGFDGRTIKSVEEYSQILREAEPNKAAEIVILRGQQRMTLTITPEAR